MRNRIVSIAFAVSASAASAQAGEFAVDTAVDFETRYVFRGIQFAETSFQPAINLRYGGFYGGVWLNLPVGADDLIVTPGGEELDVLFGYDAEIAFGVMLDIGVAYYTFPGLMSGFSDIYKEDEIGQSGANSVEPYVGVAIDAPLSLSVYLYRDFMYDTFTVQGSASQSLPLGGAFSFVIGGTTGYVKSDNPGGSYLYGQAA